MKLDEQKNLAFTNEISFRIMSQNHLKTEEEQFNYTLSNMTSGLGVQHDGSFGSHLMGETVAMDECKMSPANDALEFILNHSHNPQPVHIQSEDENIDPGKILCDLNELLRRDPNLTSLQDTANDEILCRNNINNSVSSIGMAIPRRNEMWAHQFARVRPHDYNSGLTAPPPSMASSFSNPSWQNVQIKEEPYMETGMSRQYPPNMGSFPQGGHMVPNMAAGKPMDSQDFHLDSLFLSSTSPNVSLGIGQSSRAGNFSSMQPPHHTLSNAPNTLKNINFWQMEDFSWTGANSPLSQSLADTKDFLSSSVPSGLVSRSQTSPRSEYLRESSPGATGLSPSYAGPQRNSSTLHKLLMKKETMRPPPVAGSPDRRKTYDRMRYSSQTSPLSQSAPTSDSSLMERMWIRREPRTHFTSECSVGESSVTDEVNEIIGQMSPINQQDDEEDDDFDDEDESKIDDKDSSDDSDTETNSSFQGKLSSSKKERHFWQYNVQSKGPKGQKIMIQTSIHDPHVLNEIVDPVFSGGLELQGIKHSGKARRGDGNDLTANPKKLAAIGKELEALGKDINDLAPLSETPFGARCKTRKEKNKLASRACRLKKKAQHEANKLKLHGLQEEHRELVRSLNLARQILLTKVDPACPKSQAELTEQIDQVTRKALRNAVAGCTSEYVNKQIEKSLPYV